MGLSETADAWKIILLCAIFEQICENRWCKTFLILPLNCSKFFGLTKRFRFLNHNLIKTVKKVWKFWTNLKHADDGPPFPLPKLRIGLQPVQHVERLGRIPKLAHAVAVVGQQQQQIEAVSTRLQLRVHLPRQLRLLVEHVAARQAGYVDVVAAYLWISDLRKDLLGVPVLAAGGFGLGVVEVESVIWSRWRVDLRLRKIRNAYCRESSSWSTSGRSGLPQIGRLEKRRRPCTAGPELCRTRSQNFPLSGSILRPF